MRYTVSVLTDKHLEMQKDYNEKARLVNCLVEQLLNHQAKIEELKTQHETDLLSLPYLKKELADSIEYRASILRIAEKLELEFDKIPKLRFIKRRKLRAKINEFNKRLDQANECIMPKREAYIRTNDRIDDFEESLKEVNEFNFVLHLKQLQTAIDDYNKTRNVMEAMFGLEIEPVDFYKIAKENNGELPKISENVAPIDDIKFVRKFTRLLEIEQ